MRRVGFHWFITTKFQRLGTGVTGLSCGWNQWRGAADAMDWVEGANIVRRPSAVPLINRCVKAAWKRPWRWLDKAQADVAVGVDLLDHYEAKFCGRSVRFRSAAGGWAWAWHGASVVLATGYRQTFPFLKGVGQ